MRDIYRNLGRSIAAMCAAAMLLSAAACQSGSNTDSETAGAGAKYSAVTTVEGDGTLDAQMLQSDGADENALLVDGATVEASGDTVIKTGVSSGQWMDSGTNAAILARGGANATFANLTVTTDGLGAAALYVAGEGTAVTLTQPSLTTKQNSSPALWVTGGAVSVTGGTGLTVGASSPVVVATAGSVALEGGQWSAQSSPLFRLTGSAQVSVSGGQYTAESGQIAALEGGTLTLGGVQIEGDVADSLDSATLALRDGTRLTGTLDGSTGLALELDASSTLVLTGDSAVSSLKNADASNANIERNGFTLTVGGTALK